MKKDYPQSFYWKARKAICEMLGCECLMYGKPWKKWKGKETIYAQFTDGDKRPLVMRTGYLSVMNRPTYLTLSKKAARSKDVQKEIVKKIMLATEAGDVTYKEISCFDSPCIPKGTSFEEFAIKFDMERGLK